MATSVNFFNANNLPINVNVNNAGTTFQIAAASGTTNWVPGVPTINPSFNPGPPTPGVIGIGTNSIQLTPERATAPFTAYVVLPETVNWIAVQIYVFFQSYSSCSWVVLNAGQIVSQGTALSPQALTAMSPSR